MQCIYTLGTSSVSHTYGNVASYIRLLLERRFPEGFMHHIYVDSKVAWKELNETLGNGDREFRTRHYPYMIISPQFMDQDRDGYLKNVPLTANLDSAEDGLYRNTLFPIVKDPRVQTELAYKLNRDEIMFDVEIRLRSMAQQLDVKKNLENQLKWEIPFLYKASLEAMLPRSMVIYMGRMGGIDLEKSTPENNLTPVLMNYLNRRSRHPITLKLRNDQGVDEFFMYYDTNILLTFSDLQAAQGNKKGAVDDYHPITFRVKAEFNLPGLFALMGTHEKKFQGMNFDAIVGNSSDSAAEMIPMFTFTNMYNAIPMETSDGMQFYSSTIVMADKTTAWKVEEIALSGIVAPTHYQVLKELIQDGTGGDSIFRFRILADDHELYTTCVQRDVPVCQWDVDWEMMILRIYRPDPQVTYRIVTYANSIRLNEKLNILQERTMRDIPRTEFQN